MQTVKHGHVKQSCMYSIQSLKMEPQFPTLRLGNRELFIGHTMVIPCTMITP